MSRTRYHFYHSLLWIGAAVGLWVGLTLPRNPWVTHSLAACCLLSGLVRFTLCVREGVRSGDEL